MSEERVREIAESHGRWREVTLDRDESQEVAALAREVLQYREAENRRSHLCRGVHRTDGFTCEICGTFYPDTPPDRSQP